MVRKFNWSSIEESNGGGDFTPLPAGPYVMTIVDMVDEPSREYVNLVFDVAEGEHKGYYSDDWGKEHPYAHTRKVSYKENVSNQLKGILNKIQRANPGFDAFAAWDADRLDMFRNRLVGINLQEEEVERNGEIKTRWFAFCDIVDVDRVRRGEVKPRPKRELKGKSNGGAVKKSAADVYDGDIPWEK
jgi:hypothetical protein